MRWRNWGAKETTESHHQVDIFWLKKKGCLKPGMAGTLSWSCRGEQTGSIGYRMETEQMILNYRHRPNGGDWKPVEQVISFDRTPCNYGGSRTWFRCPNCGKRVAILYGTRKYFYCRHCYDLTYACQQETPPFRLTRKAQKIRERLGASSCTDEPIFDKPKGMHKKTFERLRNESYKASDKGWEAMANSFGFSMLENLGLSKLSR